MEDSRQGVAAARVVLRIFAAGICVLGPLGVARIAHAIPLGERIPRLFGGTLSTSIRPEVTDRVPDTQKVLVAQRFSGLSAALGSARSQAPVASATGALRFEWDDENEVYTRSLESLGPLIAERARTLGRRTILFNFSYTNVNFNTLEGDDLNNLHTSQSALSPGFLASLPPGDQERARDNQLQTHLSLNFGFNLFFLTAAVMALMGGMVQINPVWAYGPFEPAIVSSPAQPDWYVGWLDGALRIFPSFEPVILGITIPSVFIPGIVIPGALFTIVALWPFIERRVTKDRGEHHLLDWPWEAPFRAASGSASATRLGNRRASAGRSAPTTSSSAAGGRSWTS